MKLRHKFLDVSAKSIEYIHFVVFLIHRYMNSNAIICIDYRVFAVHAVEVGQEVKQNDCGLRSLAWLILAESKEIRNFGLSFGEYI